MRSLSLAPVSPCSSPAFIPAALLLNTYQSLLLPLLWPAHGLLITTHQQHLIHSAGCSNTRSISLASHHHTKDLFPANDNLISSANQPARKDHPHPLLTQSTRQPAWGKTAFFILSVTHTQIRIPHTKYHLATALPGMTGFLGG